MQDQAQLKSKARSLELRGQDDAALALYRRLLQEAPDAAGAGIWARAGELELRAGRAAAAAELLERAVEMYERAGQLNVALALCHRLVRAAPHQPEAFRRLGLLSVRLGYARDARHGLVEYAQLVERAGQPEAALDALQEYLRRFPDDAAVRRRVAELSGEQPARSAPPEPVDEPEMEDLGILPTLIDPAPVREVPDWIGDPTLPGLMPTAAADAPDPAAAAGGVAPLEGLESTHAATVWDEDSGLEPLPLLDISGEHAGEPEPEPLPTWDAPPRAAEEDELPLLGFADPRTEPVPPPAPPEPEPDPVEQARARLARDPSDLGAHRALVSHLAEGDPALLGALEAARAALGAAGRHAEAAELAERLHRLRPDDTVVVQRWVEHSFHAGDRMKLIAGYLALARRYEVALDARRAQQTLERVLELDPENEEARRALAVVAPPTAAHDYVDLGALVLSDDADEPTRVRPDAAGRGEEQHDLEEILDLFREKMARTLDPKDASSHYDLGLAFKEMGLLDDAISQLQCALRAGANPLATLEVLGECFIERGDHELAARLLERATRLHGARTTDLVGVYYWLGRSHERMGDAQQAGAAYRQVVAAAPGFRDAAARLAALRPA